MFVSRSNAHTIPSDSSLRSALVAINSSTLKIAFVESPECTIVGSLTDGDIRRSLIEGKSLDSAVSSAMNRQFIFARESSDFTQLSQRMFEKKINVIPVLSENNNLIRFFILDPESLQTSYSQRDNIIVIMAGGRGSRLSPITDDCPKPMLNVGGKPMIETILDRFISSGFKTFYFSVNYLKEQIIDYFGDGSDWGVSIQYLIEDQPLGTAGSLSLLPYLPSCTTIITNCDVITDVDYTNLLHYHQAQNSDATICVREHHTRLPFGVITSQGSKLVSIEEKPLLSHFVNTGIYLLEPDCIAQIQKNTFLDMPDLFQSLLSSSYHVCSCPVHESWLDVGRYETLEQARALFSPNLP